MNISTKVDQQRPCLPQPRLGLSDRRLDLLLILIEYPDLSRFKVRLRRGEIEFHILTLTITTPSQAPPPKYTASLVNGLLPETVAPADQVL
jgi:hypothetical protein